MFGCICSYLRKFIKSSVLLGNLSMCLFICRLIICFNACLFKWFIGRLIDCYFSPKILPLTYCHTNTHCLLTFIQTLIAYLLSYKHSLLTYFHTNTHHLLTFIQTLITYLLSYKHSLLTYFHTHAIFIYVSII